MRRASELFKPRMKHHLHHDLDIDHPDAQALAHSWEDVDCLLAEVERLQRENEQLASKIRVTEKRDTKRFYSKL